MGYDCLDGCPTPVGAFVAGATKESCRHKQRRGSATSASHLNPHSCRYQNIIAGGLQDFCGWTNRRAGKSSFHHEEHEGHEAYEGQFLLLAMSFTTGRGMAGPWSSIGGTAF
jgi:hypothetical protein